MALDCPIPETTTRGSSRVRRLPVYARMGAPLFEGACAALLMLFAALSIACARHALAAEVLVDVEEMAALETKADLMERDNDALDRTNAYLRTQVDRAEMLKYRVREKEEACLRYRPVIEAWVSPNPLLLWKARSGSSMAAERVTDDGQRVTLRAPNGRVISLEHKLLEPEDAAFLDAWRDWNKLKEATP